MSNKAKMPLIPKLRFPEFRATEGWKRVPLAELVSALDAGVSVNSGDRPATENEIGILKTSAVTNGIFEPQENKVVFDEVERGRVKEPVQAGIIIISRMNTPALVGANSYVETSLENIFLPDRLWAAKSKPGTSMRFVASILGSDKGRAALSKLAKGSSGSMKNITKPDVFAFLIEAPLPDEQKKIADCLSSLDELIAAQASKVDALKTNKKGLMQQLFPREGETQPRLRFPEFRNADEWTEKKLSEAIEPAVREIAKPNSLYPALGLRSHGKGTFLKPDQDPEKNAMDKLFQVHRGDLIVNITFAWEGAVAIACAKDHGCYVSHRFPTYVFNEKISIAEFFKFVITSKSFVYKLGLISPGGAGRNRVMNKRDFLQLAVLLPDREEQQRIAACLTSLDNLITAATQELETLKTHKKGLMQQLFPSAEAVEA